MIRNIVVEGVDASGKSTLAKYLAEELQWPLHPKEGKPKTFEATLKKCRRFLDVQGFIIDRHPVVSQAIYGQIVRNDPPVPHDLVVEFHEQGNLIIYCRCIEKGMEVHLVKDGEEAAHLDRVKAMFPRLVHLYDNFGLHSSHIIYNNYGNMEIVADMVRGALNLERR